LFDRSGAAGLGHRANAPALKPIKSALLKRCRALLKQKPTLPPPRPTTASDRSPQELLQARVAQTRIVSLSLGYLLTRDERLLERAWTEIECWLNEWKSWEDPFHALQGYEYDLMVGEMGVTMGLAFSWIGEHLDEHQRNHLAHEISRRVLDLYLEETAGKKPVWWWKCDHNWNPVCNAGAIISALALRDYHPQSERIISHALKSLRLYVRALGKEGGSAEGTGYWAYGMRYAVLGLAALESRGRGTNGLLESAGMRNTGKYMPAFCPGGTPVTWGDASGRGGDAILYYLGARYGNPSLVEYQDTMPAGMPETAWPQEALSLVWRPAGIPLKSAAALARLPAGAVYREIGWSSYADNRVKPRVVSGFKCGDLAANHTHLDNNTFQLRVDGEVLARDPGNPPYTQAYFSPKRWGMYLATTAAHNGLLIDGRGQVPMKKGGLQAIPLGRGNFGVLGDASACYGNPGLRRVRRHFLILREGVAVSLDEVESSRPVGLQWLLHSEFSIIPVKDGALVRGRKTCMRVFFPPAFLRVTAGREPRVPVDRAKNLSGHRLTARNWWKGRHMVLPAVMLFGKGAEKAVVEFPDTRTTLEIRVSCGGKQHLFGWRKTPAGWKFSGLRTIKRRK
jgi:hypothetical protein